nr:DUF4123 domain-containing protein [Massilia sp. JS1662]
MSHYLDIQEFVKTRVAENPASNLYFLLDHGGLPGLHRQLSKTSTIWVSLFDGTSESSSLAVAPILVLAATDGAVQLPFSLSQWISENGTYSSSVMMLSSPLEITQLSERLKARLNVRLSGDMEAMLRFFDPRVFQSLIGILDAEQWNVFLSVAQKWWYVDRSGFIKSLNSGFNDARCRDKSLVLSAAQEFSLVDACEADQVLNALRENVSDTLQKLNISLQYDFVVSNIEEAKRFGLQSLDDLILYNVTVLLMGKSLLTEVKWSDLKHAGKLDPSKFSELVVSLENDVVSGGAK